MPLNILLLAPILEIFIPIAVVGGILWVIGELVDYIRNRKSDKGNQKAADAAWSRYSFALRDAKRFNMYVPDTYSEHVFKQKYVNSDLFVTLIKNFCDEVSKHQQVEAAKKREDEAIAKQLESERKKLLMLREEEQREKTRKQKRWEHLKVIMQDNKEQIQRGGYDGGVYVILCRKTMEVYFGSTKNLEKRKYQHFYNLRNNMHHSYSLQNAYNQYGESCFEFHVLVVYFLEDIKRRSFPAATPSDIELDKTLRRQLKWGEQNFIDGNSPEYNVDLDAEGTRHWKTSYSRY